MMPGNPIIIDLDRPPVSVARLCFKAGKLFRAGVDTAFRFCSGTKLQTRGIATYAGTALGIGFGLLPVVKFTAAGLGLLSDVKFKAAGLGLLPFVMISAAGFGMLPFPMISAAGFGLLSVGPENEPSAASDTRYTDTYLIYSVGGGMDVYMDGNRYGHILEINTDDSYRIYHRIYREDSGSGGGETGNGDSGNEGSVNGDSGSSDSGIGDSGIGGSGGSGSAQSGTIRDELVKEGELNTERLDSLRSLVDESDFFSFPHRLPDVSPLEVEYRTPAETVTITIRKDDGSMHRVQSYMGVDRRHYPEDFLEIHRFLNDWYRELIVE